MLRAVAGLVPQSVAIVLRSDGNRPTTNYLRRFLSFTEDLFLDISGVREPPSAHVPPPQHVQLPPPSPPHVSPPSMERSVGNGARVESSDPLRGRHRASLSPDAPWSSSVWATLDDFNDELEEYPLLASLKKATGIPKAYFAISAIIMFLSVVIWGYGMSVICFLAGFVVPFLHTVSVLTGHNDDDDAASGLSVPASDSHDSGSVRVGDDLPPLASLPSSHSNVSSGSVGSSNRITPALAHRKHLVCYWIFFLLFSALQPICDRLLSWLPFYYPAKLALLWWAYSPSTEGASTLYPALFRPIAHMVAGMLPRKTSAPVAPVVPPLPGPIPLHEVGSSARTPLPDAHSHPAREAGPVPGNRNAPVAASGARSGLVSIGSTLGARAIAPAPMSASADGSSALPPPYAAHADEAEAVLEREYPRQQRDDVYSPSESPEPMPRAHAHLPPPTYNPAAYSSAAESSAPTGTRAAAGAAGWGKAAPVAAAAADGFFAPTPAPAPASAAPPTPPSSAAAVVIPTAAHGGKSPPPAARARLASPSAAGASAGKGGLGAGVVDAEAARAVRGFAVPSIDEDDDGDDDGLFAPATLAAAAATPAVSPTGSSPSPPASEPSSSSVTSPAPPAEAPVATPAKKSKGGVWSSFKRFLTPSSRAPAPVVATAPPVAPSVPPLPAALSPAPVAPSVPALPGAHDAAGEDSGSLSPWDSVGDEEGREGEMEGVAGSGYSEGLNGEDEGVTRRR